MQMVGRWTRFVTLPGGRWAAFEVKLNPDDVDDAAGSLLKFRDSVDTERHGTPVAMAVITSSGYAGRRSDGVDVIPITRYSGPVI